ncbi:MAG: acetoacetate decarboxylase [Thiotrichales bacterium]|nr:acetoacetate decarboxylase [Thiotrichales bacterium]
MSLTGWTLPQTPSGKSSLLPPPPWHYSGEIISADFKAEPTVVESLLPPGMTPMGDGGGSFVFADWCSAADHDERIRDDPAVGQYREAYCVLYGLYEDKKVSRIPFIWVDSELSLIRGHVQGFPKKLGDIHMTRPVELGVGGVKKDLGSTFNAHVSSLGRRLVTLGVTLDETLEKFYPSSVARPPLHTRLFPSINQGQPAVHEFQRAKIADFQLGTVFAGSATVEFGHSEFNEIDQLGPVEIGRGYVHSMAFSVVGGSVSPIESAS